MEQSTKMRNILIINRVGFHYEIIESVIVKYFDITHKEFEHDTVTFSLFIEPNTSFQEYLEGTKISFLYVIYQTRINMIL